MTAAQPREVLERARAPAWSRYAPTPFIKLSCAAHLAGAAAFALQPSWWPWVAGGVALNHGLITFAGLMPRSRWIGENWTRLPAPAVARGEVAITLDDGPDPETTPKVLDLLEQRGATASFFVIGRHAAAHPLLVKAMVARGHSVENHTFGHPLDFSFYGLRRSRIEIERGQDAIAAITGVAPRFFRPPAGLRNVLMYPVLARLGLTHVSWTRRGFDTVADSAESVVQLLARDLSGGDILMLHDGNHYGAPPRRLVLDVLPAVLSRIEEAGLRAVSLAHATAP